MGFIWVYLVDCNLNQIIILGMAYGFMGNSRLVMVLDQ